MQGKSTEILGRLNHGPETIPSKRILILATSYLPLIGGAELAVQNLTDRLPDFSFDLITSLPYPELPRLERIGNVNMFRVGGAIGQTSFLLPKAFLPLSICAKARQLISRNQYDLIYVLQASQAGGAAWLLKTFGGSGNLPIVLNLQDGKDLARQSFMTRWSRSLIFRASDYFIVISNYLKKFLVAGGVPAKCVFLIPNGVEVREVDSTVVESLRTSLNLSDKKIIMTVSRLVPKNGIKDLLTGFAHLKKQYTEPLALIIVGGGKLESELKSQTRSLGIDSDVIYTGTIHPGKIPEYLSLADVFIRPSRSEGLGTAFLEAMVLGVPVVGTPVGGITDFLEDRETGLLCAVGDPNDIALKLQEILINEGLRNKVSSRGQELVKKDYTWEVVAEKFREFYQKLIEQPSQ